MRLIKYSLPHNINCIPFDIYHWKESTEKRRVRHKIATLLQDCDGFYSVLNISKCLSVI